MNLNPSNLYTFLAKPELLNAIESSQIFCSNPQRKRMEGEKEKVAEYFSNRRFETNRVNPIREHVAYALLCDERLKSGNDENVAKSYYTEYKKSNDGNQESIELNMAICTVWAHILKNCFQSRLDKI